MTFPFEDVVLASGSLDRPVLLSERSQLIAIKALQVAENRANWDEMSDSEWDTLEDYVADALTEILTIQEASGMELEIFGAQRLNSNQGMLAANSPNAIVWDTGSFDAMNPSRVPFTHSGWAIVHFNGWANCANAIGWRWELKQNGVSRQLWDFNDAPATNAIGAFSWAFFANAGDYIEIEIQHSQNATLLVTTMPSSIFVTQFKT